MKHHIICKFNERVTDKPALIAEIAALYADADRIEGVSKVELIPNVVDRPNRYDLMIALTMEREALPNWDSSAIHHAWKERYGALLEKKAIFDSEA